MKIIFDTETTGLDYEYDEILELAIIDENENVLFHEFFKPKRRKKWDEAEKINHISPSKVKDKKNILFYREKILKILLNADEFILYNASFDLNFINKNLKLSEEEREIIFNKKCVDVMEDFAIIYEDWNDYFEDYTWQKLITAAAYYKYHWDEEAHGALSDCKATLFVRKKIEEELNI